MAQIIYGIHPVKEALKPTPPRMRKILMGSQKPHPALQAILDLARVKKIPVTFTSKETLGKMTGGGLHQNIAAIVDGTSYSTVGEILSAWRKGGTKALLLILDGIQDPQNLGSLLRTALGSGVHGVIIPKDRAVGITPAVVKASAGTAIHMPIARVVNMASTLEALKKEGIWVYGASGEAKDLIYRLDFKHGSGHCDRCRGKRDQAPGEAKM